MNNIPIEVCGSQSCHFSHFSNVALPNDRKNILLARKIESKMKERGLSRQEFARLMEVQPSIITRWLSGRHNFTLETIYEIERKLDFQIVDVDNPAKPTNIHISLLVESSHTHWPNPKELMRPFGILFGSQIAAHPSVNIISNYACIEQATAEDNDHLQDEILRFIGRRIGT